MISLALPTQKMTRGALIRAVVVAGAVNGTNGVVVPTEMEVAEEDQWAADLLIRVNAHRSRSTPNPKS